MCWGGVYKCAWGECINVLGGVYKGAWGVYKCAGGSV